MKFDFFTKKHRAYLHPDEIFLDSRNLPSFDDQQFEGRIEKPLTKKIFVVFGAISLMVFLIYFGRLGQLQVVQGSEFALRSENNTLRHRPIFPERGVITDRNGVELAWNQDGQRIYVDKEGFGHVLGYVGFPSEKDLANKEVGYFPKEYIGRDGVEKYYDKILRGTPGIQIEEIDVRGQIRSDSKVNEPVAGSMVVLGIDVEVQEKMYVAIKNFAKEHGFTGGAGVIMNVNNGEILALASYPEYNSNVLAESQDTALINSYFSSKSYPFLNRVVSGLYTPGSIVKPFVALGALAEKVITPEKEILSTGSLTLPNPYNPDKPSVFNDWKAHGYVDMREAIAVSSDVYFYEIGGGFVPDRQKGIGVANIKKYTEMFGISQPTGIDLLGEATGVIPTPEWKAANFDGEPWLLGNTYHTAIGQYGFQVTPIQMARAIGGIATEGLLVKPSLKVKANVEPPEKVDLPVEYFKVVKEGMRGTVTMGTSQSLNLPQVKVAAKSGTAELGVSREYVNSWIVGFFPYENPQYAFAVVMEKGSRTNTVGATTVFRGVLEWLVAYAPEYLE